MNSSGGALFALFLFLQLVAAIALLVGGIYTIYCLHRMNENLNRLAEIAETWMMMQQVPVAPPTPMPVVGRVEHVAAPPANQTADQPVNQPVNSPADHRPASTATQTPVSDNESNL